jgi:hypothetical protein
VATHHRARSRLAQFECQEADVGVDDGLITRTNDLVCALGALGLKADRAGDADLAQRCDAAKQALIEPGKVRCRACGQVIPADMVRMVGPEGIRHVAGALVCRKVIS